MTMANEAASPSVGRASDQRAIDQLNQRGAPTGTVALASGGAERMRGEFELPPLVSPTLVETVYAISKEQIPAEERRMTLLMGKANSLLSVAGLSLTVAFTLGGLLLQRGELHSVMTVVPYVLALLAGLGAAGCAIHAMGIRDSRAISPTDVLNASALAVGEELDVGGVGNTGKATVGNVESTGKASTGLGTIAYKRFLAEHFWLIYTENSKRSTYSATWIQRGQWRYLVFLVSVFVTGIVLAFDVAK
jgi:hypothetical protein